ncbi:FecR family protein [Pedobacter sp.]|uniref:FecR family protein n=1 Tax=Pedobacter sp. TaxID=1411316 RepID=UPI003BA962F2
MQINQKLVDKFFAGQCTAEEARMVSKFLEEPSNREIYLNPSDWEEFVVEDEVPGEISDRVYVNVLDHIHEKKAAKRVKLKYLAYAASVALVFSAGWLVFSTKPEPQGVLTQVVKQVKKPVAARVLTFFTNTSNTKKNYTLPDGTLVTLNPNSEVSFLPFDQGKRDVKLVGEGLFKVHKDKTKPFTVYANNLATTALGTVFSVTAFKKGVFTKVNLIEGKVVVRPQNLLELKGIKTVYLTPGKSFTVNMQTYYAVVTDLNAAPIKKVIAAEPSRAIITERAIAFDNESLAGVFNVLETKLNIQIKYNANQISKKVFTGQYEFGRDDADSFLNMLCALNNLVAEKTDAGYTIKTINTKAKQAMHN